MEQNDPKMIYTFSTYQKDFDRKDYKIKSPSSWSFLN